jgi:hypothetical protein
VSVAVRPKYLSTRRFGRRDQWIFVVNHVSDSINIVSLRDGEVKQTLQRVVDGVTTTNEPIGIVFDGPDRAFVTLDEPNQVIRLEPLDPAEPDGPWHVADERLQLYAQSPRAITIQDRRLLVAAFESGNRTVFPSCGKIELCEGCQEAPQCQVELPHGGTTPDSVTLIRPIVFDPLALDRDLWVYDLDDLGSGEPVQIVEGVGSLLFGMTATDDGRVYVSNTDARNALNGLDLLDNQMFENRLSVLDCSGIECSLLDRVDLEDGGRRFPTPHAIDALADGSLLVVTASGSDGEPLPLAGGGSRPNDGLFTLDRDGRILGGVPVGAIPQGVVLGADPRDASRSLAYVWSGQDYTVQVVDVTDPETPEVLEVLLDDPRLALDPLPEIVREGRKWFRSARGSTSGTFGCESCHPNAATDQLLWTINSRDDVILVDGEVVPDENGALPQPRNTMPAKGLRDTLPLHWDGVLGNPLIEDGGCSLDHRSEKMTEECLRHLVDAGLAAVMCDPESCSETEGRPGAYTDAQRRAMAAYLATVSVSPGPARRDDDVLSTSAIDGLKAIESIGCDRAGCHSLPLYTSPTINSDLGSNAVSIRGVWDRHILASNGVFNSRAAMELSNEFLPFFSPGTHPDNYVEKIGIDENSALNAFLTYIFFAVGRHDIMQLSKELSVGHAGVLGRQLSLSEHDAFSSPSGEPDPSLVASVEAIESAARDGKITAVAHTRSLLRGSIRLRYQERSCDGEASCSDWVWRMEGEDWLARLVEFESLFDLLRSRSFRNRSITVRADLPPRVVIPAHGFPTDAQRMPLIWPDFDTQSATHFAIPTRPDASGRIQVFGRYVAPDARVFLDGALCKTCSLLIEEEPVLEPGQLEIQQPLLIRKQLSDGRIVDNHPDAIHITLSELPEVVEFPFLHILQVQNPSGYLSNDLPLTLWPSAP